jgi:4-amino-4-deoxy-L-arabinose transferase-like glycosyltransferase
MSGRLALGSALFALFFLASGSWYESFWKQPATFPVYSLGLTGTIVLASHGLGKVLFKLFPVSFSSLPESLAMTSGVGVGVLGYLVLLAGALNLLYPQVFWGLLPFLVFFSLRRPARVGRGEERPPLEAGEKALLLGLGFLAFIHFTLSLGPPLARDVLTQHLALPKLYVQHHRVFNLPFAEASFNPMQVDMLYTLALLLKCEPGASLIHSLFSYLTAALIYSFLRPRASRRVGLLGSLLYLSVPLVMNLSSKPYVDLALAFFSWASLYGLMQKGGEEGKWLILSAIMAGFGAATKYNGFLVLLLLLPWVLRCSKEGSLSGIQRAGRFFTISLAVASPWLVRNILLTGNPFFPFLSTWLGNMPVISQEIYEPLARRTLLYGEGLLDFLTIPIRIFFQGKDDIPRYFDGELNPVFLFFFPFVLGVHKERWVGGLLIFVSLYFLFTLLLTDMRARYILPTLPPLAVLAALGIKKAGQGSGKWLAGSVLVGCLFWNASYLYGHIQKAELGLYLLGKESREAYLSRKLGDFDLWHFANRHLPADAKVMMYFLGNRGYYSDREYIYEDYYSGRELKQFLSRSPSAERLVEYFKERRITHIALRKDLFDQFTEANLLSVEKEAWGEFRTRHLRLLYEGKGYQLYQIQGGPDASGL